MSDLDATLWNDEVTPANYAEGQGRYQGVLFEQYKLCVEMADPVSARRGMANTFFIPLNTAVVAILTAVPPGESGRVSLWLLLPGLMVLIASCVAWYVLVLPYRQLNRAKWAVIGAFEKRLPAYAYSNAEWVALGEGRDWRR